MKNHNAYFCNAVCSDEYPLDCIIPGYKKVFVLHLFEISTNASKHCIIIKNNNNYIHESLKESLLQQFMVFLHL